MELKQRREFEPVIFNLPSDLKTKLKIQAAKKKITMTAYLTGLIKQNLK